RLSAWIDRRVLLRRAAASENFRTADQQARINAKRPAAQAEHHGGTDAETAATNWQTSEPASARAAIFAPAILDVFALRQIFPTHRSAPSGKALKPRLNGGIMRATSRPGVAASA